ncbi:MAG: hypothetical protein IJD60_11705 [Clostridia bacterium]|nr:hypothetical protein [Clostridia bacterium]
MKKGMLAGLLVLALFVMSGCESATQALAKIGDEIEAAQLKTPQDNSASTMDWSFVPVVRDMATKMFAEGVPDASIVDTRVASKSGSGERVIVVIEFDRAGKRGTYGFDYEKNAQGEYELKRLGEGVRTDDLN